ncbi:MAG TPA: hypothetical protein ENK81_02975 [Euryarchaeota archaeon]|nr:hypothetical protein [Euryarchaeota archaeon]
MWFRINGYLIDIPDVIIKLYNRKRHRYLTLAVSIIGTKVTVSRAVFSDCDVILLPIRGKERIITLEINDEHIVERIYKEVIKYDIWKEVSNP